MEQLFKIFGPWQVGQRSICIRWCLLPQSPCPLVNWWALTRGCCYPLRLDFLLGILILVFCLPGTGTKSSGYKKWNNVGSFSTLWKLIHKLISNPAPFYTTFLSINIRDYRNHCIFWSMTLLWFKLFSELDWGEMSSKCWVQQCLTVW